MAVVGLVMRVLVIRENVGERRRIARRQREPDEVRSGLGWVALEGAIAPAGIEVNPRRLEA